MKPIYTISHPQALIAIWLAHKLAGMSPWLITRVLNASQAPRKLFVLAADLRAESSGGGTCA